MMKQTYMTPEAEKIQFNYRDQVVAASNVVILKDGSPTLSDCDFADVLSQGDYANCVF